VNSYYTTKIKLETLTFRPFSEAYIRRSWYSIPLDLDTINASERGGNVKGF